MDQDDTPSHAHEARVSAFLAAVKRYRWWDPRASSPAAMTAIREHIAAHLERLARYGLAHQGDAFVASVSGNELEGAALDGDWLAAVAKADEAALRAVRAGVTPAHELAEAMRPAVQELLADPRAITAAMELLVREIHWLREHGEGERSPWAPLLSVFALGAWPVGMTREGYFVLRAPTSR